jgi:hypothetical protein
LELTLVKKTIFLFAVLVLVFSACASSPSQTTSERGGELQAVSIVNMMLSDLKTQTSLSLLQGHVAINISSGNKTLDKQLDEAIQNAYPNFTAKADTVNNEDVYQMAVKVYRKNNEVIVNTVVTNFTQKNIVERNVLVTKVSVTMLETLQYETAIAAKNEFDVYLDSAFSSTGALVENLQLIPPPPPKPPFDWSKLRYSDFWCGFSFVNDNWIFENNEMNNTSIGVGFGNNLFFWDLFGSLIVSDTASIDGGGFGSSVGNRLLNITNSAGWIWFSTTLSFGVAYYYYSKELPEFSDGRNLSYFIPYAQIQATLAFVQVAYRISPIRPIYGFSIGFTYQYI